MGRSGELLAEAGAGEEVDLIAATTPFYGESGGQVGDTGRIETEDGARLDVFDTQKPAADATVHRARVVEGRVRVGQEIRLSIDARRREAIRLNHSSTHLLHAALRHHLGTGVHQAGSLVDESRLRFDFSHDGPVADEKLVDIEAEVNEAIRANHEVETREMPYDEAIKAGALAFFGEKYGDVVRVVRMGDYSVELCGGTHVRRTGDVGLLRLSSESGVAAGVRRVEATTGSGALEQVRARDHLLRELGRLLRSPEEQAPEKVARLLAGMKELEKRISEMEQRQSGDAVQDLLRRVREVDGWRVIVARIDGVDAKGMRTMSDQLRDRIGSGVVVLAAEVASGVAVTVAVTPDLTSRYQAGSLIKELVPLVDGRGGGKPEFAQAGGKNAAGIEKLLEKANELVG